MLSEILDHRLVFVSGKGGVGKTTTAMLLALFAAKKKKRTLIVEMNSSGLIAPLFNTSSNGQEEISLAPYISGINLSPNKCFEEYVLKRLHFKALYQAFFNNKFVSNFLDAIPGLNDILMLGKIYDLERQYKNKLMAQRTYDLVIVDAPATGHGLSTLEVPRVLRSAVKIGPLNSHATDILNMLADKKKTIFCLVTLAEEMPVNESREYINALKERTNLNFGPLFVNAVMPEIKSLSRSIPSTESGINTIKNYHNLAVERAKLNQIYIKKINEFFPDFKKIVLPFQFNEIRDYRGLIPLLHLLTEGSS
ncbi:MAG: ArsA family ATPase [Deltaproteobacteria bacterium]|nr:ArsA family ATPase [Deltaproteobacteria bacterium]